MISRIPRFGLVAVVLAIASLALALDPEVERALQSSKYVYISSQRKDGSWSRPAEIWFLYYKGAVYVGTAPNSWRVRRIRWGRPKAKIAVGNVNGPVFFARGEIVHEPDTIQKMLEVFAKKYAERWAQHAESFEQGFRDGRRVLVRYTPQ